MLKNILKYRIVKRGDKIYTVADRKRVLNPIERKKYQIPGVKDKSCTFGHDDIRKYPSGRELDYFLPEHINLHPLDEIGSDYEEDYEEIVMNIWEKVT